MADGPWVVHGLPMGFHGFGRPPMGYSACPWVTHVFIVLIHGSPMNLPRVSYGSILAHGSTMALPWVLLRVALSCGYLHAFMMLAHGSPVDHSCVTYGPPVGSQCLPMVSPLGSYCWPMTLT